SLHAPSSCLVGRLEDEDWGRRGSPLSPSPSYAVYWLDDGSGTLRIDFEDYRLRPNRFYFVAPGQVLSWNVTGALTGWNLSFSVDFLEGGMADLRFLMSLSYFHELDKLHELVPPPESKAAFGILFSQLLEESNLGTMESSIMAQSLLRLLLIRLQRLYPRRWESPVPTAGQRLTEDYCRLVGSSFLERRRVADYATLLGVSADHLSATFRETTGLSPGILIQNHLVLEAKRLLAHSNLTVAETAVRLKFKDASYFSRFFRRATGVSPSEFKAEAAKRAYNS
ncbi:MAG: AraC family transcriptional regulator, partial [Spirochaetota bacterium]